MINSYSLPKYRVRCLGEINGMGELRQFSPALCFAMFPNSGRICIVLFKAFRTSLALNALRGKAQGTQRRYSQQELREGSCLRRIFLSIDCATVTHRALLFCKFFSLPHLPLASRCNMSNSIGGTGYQHVELAFVTPRYSSLLTIGVAQVYAVHPRRVVISYNLLGCMARCL